MMVEDMIQSFLESRRQGHTGAKKKAKDVTLTLYERNVRKLHEFLLAQEPPILDYASMTKRHFYAFLEGLDHAEKDGVFSKATHCQILRTLRSFLRWVDLDEDCQEENVKPWSRYLGPIEKTPRRTYLPEQSDLKRFRDAILTKPSTWGFRDYVCFKLFLTTGIRAGELASLTLGNVKLGERTLYVTGKTGGRTVPITADMAALLKRWLTKRQTLHYGADSEYVFVTKRAPQMDSRTLAQRFCKMRLKDPSLPKISQHVARHLFATRYLERGGKIDRLKNLLGHSSYDMLWHYVHTADVAGKEAHDELEKVNPAKGL